MPKKVERALRATAKARGYGAARTDRYVYGGLRRTGWTPGRSKKRGK